MDLLDATTFFSGICNYVDLCGSDPLIPGTKTGADNATIRTKNRIVWEEKNYDIVLRVAGNKRFAYTTGDIAEVVVWDKNDTIISSNLVTVTDYQQAFTSYSFSFTPTSGQSGGLGGKITVRAKSGVFNTGTVGTFEKWLTGPLLGLVMVSNVTDTALVFLDDFDN